MSTFNQDTTIHEMNHKTKNFNCELCTDEFEIIKGWYQMKWISYKEYLRLTGLPF